MGPTRIGEYPSPIDQQFLSKTVIIMCLIKYCQHDTGFEFSAPLGARNAWHLMVDTEVTK